MNDKRSVATDALASLGTLDLGENPGRDAIHLAVFPAVATETLYPNQDVGLVGKDASIKSSPHVGKVDPFLKEPVYPGQTFWLVLYPRTITSLRHVWEHPNVPEEEATIVTQTIEVVKEVEIIKEVEKTIDPKVQMALNYLSEYVSFDYYDTKPNPTTLETRIREFAYRALDSDYEEYLTIYGDDASGGIPSEFWDHVETLTGKRPAQPPTWFSCSC